jgi:hypothetical protein
VSDEALFSTAAQVIPVLWIVMMLELRLFFPSPKGLLSGQADKEHQQTPWLTAAALAVTGLLMILGEWRAITTLVQDEVPSEGDRDVVARAMYLGVFWVFVLPWLPWVETTMDRTPLGRFKFWTWGKLGVGTADPYRDRRLRFKRKSDEEE